MKIDMKNKTNKSLRDRREEKQTKKDEDIQ